MPENTPYRGLKKQLKKFRAVDRILLENGCTEMFHFHLEPKRVYNIHIMIIPVTAKLNCLLNIFELISNHFLAKIIFKFKLVFSLLKCFIYIIIKTRPVELFKI